MNKLIPEGFRELRVTDDFVGLIGPLWYKAEGEKLRVGLPLEPRHGNPMGWAHGGLLVTVADMVMGAGSGHATGIRWPHPTVSLSSEFVRGARLGQWLEGTARIARNCPASMRRWPRGFAAKLKAGAAPWVKPWSATPDANTQAAAINSHRASARGVVSKS